MATILLVEDDITLAETLRYNLEREGYSVIVVHDGVLAPVSYTHLDVYKRQL